MKQIVMLQGMGNNERGWARLVSKFGRVVLIQQGMIQHVEIWEHEKQIFNGPETSVMKTRRLDECLFSLLTMVRSWKRVREFCGIQKIDVVIAPNYSMGLVGIFLRTVGRADRAIVWLSDYLPPRGSFMVKLHRRITTALNRFAARAADEVWTISPRIPTATVNPRNFVVPICLNESETPAVGRTEIGYIGIPSPDHALDTLFAIARKHGIRVNIIGDSPYLKSIQASAPEGTVFHGLLNDPVKIDRILARCFCGYAVYRNTGPQSYSYFGIPSKAFAFLGSNTPVVTTNTAHFTATLGEAGIARVVEPDSREIEAAILDIRDNFSRFYDAVITFRKQWNAHAEKFHRERLGVAEPVPAV